MKRILLLIFLLLLGSCKKEKEKTEESQEPLNSKYTFNAEVKALIYPEAILHTLGKEVSEQTESSFLDSLIKTTPGSANVVCSTHRGQNNLSIINFYSNDSIIIKDVYAIMSHLYSYNDTINTFNENRLAKTSLRIKNLKDTIESMEQEIQIFKFKSGFNTEPTPEEIKLYDLIDSLKKEQEAYDKQQIDKAVSTSSSWIKVLEDIELTNQKTGRREFFPFPLPAPSFSGPTK